MMVWVVSISYDNLGTRILGVQPSDYLGRRQAVEFQDHEFPDATRELEWCEFEEFGQKAYQSVVEGSHVYYVEPTEFPGEKSSWLV